MNIEKKVGDFFIEIEQYRKIQMNILYIIFD